MRYGNMLILKWNIIRSLLTDRYKAFIMSEEASTQNSDLAQWMRDLPLPLKNIPLIYLAIPGSHDSMTYGITRSSGLAPDAEPILHRLYPLFRGTILRWTITQSVDTMQQLLIGIRYLDLRLATKTGTQSFYFTHGLYAEEISGPLIQVKQFIDAHPGEVVILDCQHFYGFTGEDHQRLIRFLLNLYGPRLVPRQQDLTGITLAELERRQQQIIVVYRHESVFSTGQLWQTQALPSPWPRQDRAGALLAYLTHVRRPTAAGFVHQAVLTPTPGFILLRWISNLRDKCAVPVLNEVFPELMKLSPGAPRNGDELPVPVNVVIADFVDMEDALFPRGIIQLNMKLLKNTQVIYHNVNGDVK